MDVLPVKDNDDLIKERPLSEEEMQHVEFDIPKYRYSLMHDVSKNLHMYYDNLLDRVVTLEEMEDIVNFLHRKYIEHEPY